MKKLLISLSLMLLPACQGNDNDSPAPSTPTPDPLQTIAEPGPVLATPLPTSEVHSKSKPESLIECVATERKDLVHSCRLTQPSMILDKNPNGEMRSYQIEYDMSCFARVSQLTEIRIRAQLEGEGEVVGQIRTGRAESYIIRGTGDLIIEDLKPKFLSNRYFTECDLSVKFQQI